MRRKIYICVIGIIVAVLLLWCPVSFIMDKTGIIKVKDLANYKDPEKLYYYDEEEAAVKVADYFYSTSGGDSNSNNIPFTARLYMNTLNGIEQGKAAVENIYTNHIPFYAEILQLANSFGNYMQEEFVIMLYNRENLKAAVETVHEEEAQTETKEMESSEENEKLPEPPQTKFIALKINDAGMFRVYKVRSEDNSIGFLDISMAMRYEEAAKNMLDEQANINRIAAANTDVNFFVYIATRMQDTAYYNAIIPAANESSTKKIFDDFIDGITGTAGIAWFDIDTFEKRIERCFKTDHHWNALGAYQGYTEVIDMMSGVIPDIGDPLPLKGLIEFPNVEYRGSGAARTQTPVYYDSFAVMDIDLPKQHPAERVTSRLDEYLNGKYDAGKVKDIYVSHYENFYNRPEIITYPDNNTGRRLLILGDSYVYWVSWLIGAHFDKTYVHYTLDQNDLDYNKFIEKNKITDVLLLQYSARTLSKATSASKYLEQVITK